MTTEKKAFEIETKDNFTLIKLDGDMVYFHCKAFDDEIPAITESGKPVFIDCNQVFNVSKDWIRSLLRIHVNLKTTGKELNLIHVNSTFLTQLKNDGLDKTFRLSKDMQSAMKQAGLEAPKRTLNTEFINPFLNATLHVLKVQAQVEATAGQIYVKKADEKITGDISGVIGIVSQDFTGSVVISFPEKTFLNVISSMLGEEFTTLNSEIIDGAGELTNMIFGQAKITLNEKGYGIKTALPSVIAGKDHSLNAMTKGPVVVVPFTTPKGNFFVEICLSH